MKKKLLIAIVLKALVILCGCAAVKYPTYYTLNVPPPPDPPAQGILHASLAVREFRSPVSSGPTTTATGPTQE